MTPQEIKTTRIALGLSVAQLATMLDTDPQTIRRMEMDASASTARKPAGRMLRLIDAYASGYRPPDWPDQKTGAAAFEYSRARAMHARRAEGATLDEIGAEFGPAPERILQIFRKAGLA